MIRTKIVPAVVALLGVLAVLTIIGLERRSADARWAQVQVADVKTELTQLQGMPFQMSPATGASPERASATMEAAQEHVADLVDRLSRKSPLSELPRLKRLLSANDKALDEFLSITTNPTAYEHGNAEKLVADAGRILAVTGRTMGQASLALALASRKYDRRATTADSQATVGSVLAIVLLLVAFVVFYLRSLRARSTAERLARENALLADAKHVEARTDALTGLRNRRALADDLDAEARRPEGQRELMLALYDLDGFKQYNDTFGHPAGDVLLMRLAERLEVCVDGEATAYRMGGDEFCVLAVAGPGGLSTVTAAGHALCETGGAFEISCSYGTATMPAEAATSADALRLADQRMYENKAGGMSASRQSGDVLLKVLSERSIELRHHGDGVAGLATRTARRLGLGALDIRRIGLAAELHDVGKTAIPDAILNKSGDLDADEWEFMRRHTLIGERILLAAPSLAPAAELVRSSHEWFDGTGYPDQLSGDRIPLGAAIIAVCDAYDAMVSDRPYHAAIPAAAALEELERCAGTQFDPTVIEAFCALCAENETALAAA